MFLVSVLKLVNCVAVLLELNSISIESLNQLFD